MKSRECFVSNSSSSSFIIRGLVVNEDKLASLLGIPPEEKRSYGYNFGMALKEKNCGLEVHGNSNFFGGDPTGEVILGIDLPEPQDGQVVEIKDDSENDQKLKEGLAKLGLKDYGSFSTFFQYVSNDNY